MYMTDIIILMFSSHPDEFTDFWNVLINNI